MAEYEVDFGFGMAQVFGKRSPAPGSLAGSMPAPLAATSPSAPSGYISDMADPDRYRKMADNLRRDFQSRTAPAGSVNGGMAQGSSGRLPSPVPTMNAYGNDLTQANRFNAMADSMKRDRQAYSAPSGSLAGSMALGDTGQLPALGSSPTTTTSAPATVNSYGNDLSQANRMNAMAADMKRQRLSYSAPPSGSLGNSMTLGKSLAVEPVNRRTWGGIGQMPAFRQVENAGAMGGNF